MKKKATFEEVLKKFDEIWAKGCSWDMLLEWRKEIKAMGWSDEEFDSALWTRFSDKIVDKAA